MLIRMIVYVLLIIYSFFCVLQIIRIRKEIRLVKMHPSTKYIEETDVDHNQIETSSMVDIISWFFFFVIVFNITGIWRGCLRMIYQFWEPEIFMERPPNQELLEEDQEPLEEDDD